MKNSKLSLICALSFSTFYLSGCLLAAVGVGAEAGYVASQDDRTAQETINDQYITSAVKTKLLADSRTPGLDINVDTFKSVVTLRGALKTNREASNALEVARSVDGVKSVISKLVVVK